MFKVQISNSGKSGLGAGKTSPFQDNILAIDSDHPDKHAELVMLKEDPALRATIASSGGFRGIGIGNGGVCPLDLVVALSINEIPYDAIEGEDILDIPQQELPPGAVW